MAKRRRRRKRRPGRLVLALLGVAAAAALGVWALWRLGRQESQDTFRFPTPSVTISPAATGEIEESDRQRLDSILRGTTKGGKVAAPTR